MGYAKPAGEKRNTEKTLTWTSDNGNGTFTNPLFYDEFSDPDLIRVGDDYYLAGTTMHAMPGLPVLHSKDLVNWKFLTYAYPKLDFGPDISFTKWKGHLRTGHLGTKYPLPDSTFYIFQHESPNPPAPLHGWGRGASVGLLLFFFKFPFVCAGFTFSNGTSHRNDKSVKTRADPCHPCSISSISTLGLR